MWAGITGVVIGLLIGGTGVAIWLKKREGSPETVASLKRENAQFREEVNEHFVQTAELINQLTDSYKAVFDHLSEGAEKLVEPDAVRERMPQVTDEEVRLKRIGAQRDPAVPVGEDSAAVDAAAAAEQPDSESARDDDAPADHSSAADQVPESTEQAADDTRQTRDDSPEPSADAAEPDKEQRGDASSDGTEPSDESPKPSAEQRRQEK